MCFNRRDGDSPESDGARRWLAAQRKVRELKMVGRALASTAHPVLAQIIPCGSAT